MLDLIIYKLLKADLAISYVSVHMTQVNFTLLTRLCILVLLHRRSRYFAKS